MTKNLHYPLHPQTLRSLKSGHPWITKDKFSEKFPNVKPLIQINHPDTGKFIGFFLNDKQHPRVVARLWSLRENENNQSFKKDLVKRLSHALEKRSQLSLDRQNIYLVFGETDHLPGLYIQQLGDHLLIQFQAFIWLDYQQTVIDFLKSVYPSSIIWTQKRLPGEQKEAPRAYDEFKENIQIKEFDIHYHLKMNLNHDIGIYTDASSLRKKLLPYLKNKKRMLNLFCYTGAFSLNGLKEGLDVTSVDLSKTYLTWLEENIILNQFESSKHRIIAKSCQKAVAQLIQEGQSFDFLLCDPPTFSTDGKKRMKATDFYQQYADDMISLLGPDGIGVFMLNTHSFSVKKFKEMLHNTLKKRIKIIEQLTMAEDCLPLKNFPEGNYLKCLIFKLD